MNVHALIQMNVHYFENCATCVYNFIRKNVISIGVSLINVHGCHI